MSDPAGAATRRALQAVAELLLAGPQHRRAGTIKLLVRPGGFGTLTDGGPYVDGVDLVAGDRRLAMTGRTCADLAADAGIDIGAPDGVYHDGSGATPDETLRLDPGAASWIAHCWAAGDAALRRLAPAQTPILWPEHFDVAILDGDSGYGVSPGDRLVADPYAYVTPRTPRRDDFWNAPFGAARPMRELGHGDADSVLAFFIDARHRASDPH